MMFEIDEPVRLRVETEEFDPSDGPRWIQGEESRYRTFERSVSSLRRCPK